MNDEQRERIHVPCDDGDCEAIYDPETIDEYRVALDHWINHSYLHGCSHGS